MLELNANPAPADDLIKDVSEATFMEDVVEASKTTPVIVDFWAPWCGPCKTLGPALEAAVKAAGGKIKMVKVNVDENQGIAGQLRVQSIPTVFAFHDGQPVDGFQGAVPPSEIEAFIQKAIDLAPEEDNGLADAIIAAEEMLAEGSADDAAQTFAAVLEEEPNNPAAFSGLVKSHMALGELEKAQAMIANIPAEIENETAVQSVKAQVELAASAADAGEAGELLAKLEANPDDHEARQELATVFVGEGKVEEAIDELLDLFRRDRDWKEGAAKEQLFKIFDSLGPMDEMAKTGRRKLSSMIFA
ncbi:MAG: thioredoxin [Amylibacter sp.]|jgi:putative thioredoxin|nr:thioredoxin [Amylibacter sp.]